MKTVSARNANQAFSKLLNEVAAGEEVVITKRGEPVARLVKYDQRPVTEDRRKAAKQLADDLLKIAQPLGIESWTRDELYERR